MNIFKWVQKLVEYIGNGVRRLFSPSDDDFPETGVQPFAGDSYKEEN
jgi:hypothetical protein